LEAPFGAEGKFCVPVLATVFVNGRFPVLGPGTPRLMAHGVSDFLPIPLFIPTKQKMFSKNQDRYTEYRQFCRIYRILQDFFLKTK
jgi:hypothetical protein